MRQLEKSDRSLSAYMAEVCRHPVLTPEEELAAARRYRDTGDVDAARTLVTANLRFVVKIAHEYAGYGMRLADLVQEGNIGLMKAVQKFDPDRGYRLITYAVWWIRAHIQAFILRTWSLVKIGTTQAQRKLFFSLSRARRELARLDGSDPADGEMSEAEEAGVAGRLRVGLGEVGKMRVRMRNRDVSLNELSTDNLGEPYRDTRIDRLVDPDADVQSLVVRKMAEEDLSGRIGPAFERLTEKERYVVENRVMSDEPPTLSEIGGALGISRQRVLQIEQRALKILRAELGDLAPSAS